MPKIHVWVLRKESVVARVEYKEIYHRVDLPHSIVGPIDRVFSPLVKKVWKF